MNAMTQNIQFTLLTNDNGLLTKEVSLGTDGKLAKGTKAFLSHGKATKVAVATLSEFSAKHLALKPNECLAYGVTGSEVADIVVAASLHKHPGKIARDRTHFHYRKGPAILMLDHDPCAGSESLTPDALRNALIEACPALAGAPMLWTASASGNIFDMTTGKQLAGLLGQRIYTPVEDGTDIPRAGKALYEHLWRTGHGTFVVSKGARLLDRNLIDASVWQPERLDFAVGASCVPPLEQRRPAHVIWEGSGVPFDSTLVADLTSAEKDTVARAKRDARSAVDGERQKVRGAYIEARASELAKERGLDVDKARQVISDSLDRDLLFADFVLYPEGGDPVTVGEVLNAPDHWHGRRFADPVEPDYRNDKRIAHINLRSGGRPYLYSHAHGGHRYLLLRQPTRVELTSGEMPRIADECVELIRQNGDLYDFGYRQIVRVAENRIHPVNPNYMADYLGRIARFERLDKRSGNWYPTDTPERLATMVCERAGERGLSKLRAIVTAPILRSDGTVLDKPGFDSQSGLLYQTDDIEHRSVPLAPDENQVFRALLTLWRPFKDFPFADDISRGAMLSAILSVVIRRALPTCPGHIFDAPVMGSGKTLLARCIAAIGGHVPELSVPPSENEEARKSLFAALREGAGCIIWDNVDHTIGGSAINNFLTAPIFKDRILGVSQSEALPNSAMFLATGNNIRVEGDAARRFVVCRIDAKVEQPYLREFTFDPLQRVIANRVDLVIAALTLIRGYIAVGSPRMARGNTASFEDWDTLVRQTVCWVASAIDLGIGFDDPMKTVEKNAATDPQKGALHSLLERWHVYLGDAEKTSAEVFSASQTDDLSMGSEETPKKELADAIGGLSSSEGSYMNAHRLGQYLGKHEDEIVGGLALRSRLDSNRKIKLWRVECVVEVEA